MRGWFVAEKRLPGAYASPAPIGKREFAGAFDVFGLTDATSNAGPADRGGDDWAPTSGAYDTPMTIDTPITAMAVSKWRCFTATRPSIADGDMRCPSPI